MKEFDIFNVINDLIVYAYKCAEEYSKFKNSSLSYVKNDIFPEGVYRIHKCHLIPKYLIEYIDLNTIISSIVINYADIEFDTHSGWFTFRK